MFSLTWPASMQIYWNKRKRLHKKKVQLPEDWFGTPTWPLCIVLGHQYGRRDVMWKHSKIHPRSGSRRDARVPPLFSDQNETRRAPKKFFWDRVPPYLSVWITWPLPPSTLIWRSGCANASGYSLPDPTLACIETNSILYYLRRFQD